MNLKIFKTKWFTRFARKSKLSDGYLIEAVNRAEKGLVDSDLGSGLIKQRIAREGSGRSKGYRTIIAYKENKRAIFLYGFAKNEKENIEDDELESWKEIAQAYLKLNEQDMKKSVVSGFLEEINHDKK